MPIVTDVRDRPVLVVGSAGEAVPKANLAASFGADVTLVDEEAPTERLETLDPAVRVEPTALTEDHLATRIDAAVLVFADTGDDALDRRVSRLAREQGVPVNVVDKPDLCTFIMPAYARGDRYVVAISTFGNSPMACRILREELDRELDGFDGLVAIQADLRAALKRRGLPFDVRRDLLYAAGTDPAVRRALAEGDIAGARERSRALVERTEVAP